MTGQDGVSPAKFRLDPLVRRRALRLGLLNAALWAMGNGLTTGSLVNYLARDLGARGAALGILLAAPNLAGVLRLIAPTFIRRAGTARRGCLQFNAASYLLIAALPILAAAAPRLSRPTVLMAMIGLLFAHQMLEYLGTVALWTWWHDLVPRPIRGRYFACRQRVQLAVGVPTLLAGGYLADLLREQYRGDPDRLLLAYALPTGVGALALLTSLVPLAMMPPTRVYAPTSGYWDWRSMIAPFTDSRFFRVLAFRGWFSLANGVSQTVQNVVFPKDVLQMGVGPMSAMRVGMQIGQFAGSGPVGRFSDRFGNRPAIVLAQCCVSASLVFYLLATPRWPWLLAGAWVLFAFYVAHNICLPNLVLKLAEPEAVSGYVAASEAIASLFHALSTVGGGLLFDWLERTSPLPEGEPYRSCLIVLAVGLLMRSLAVPLAATIDEPGAWRWPSILKVLFAARSRGRGTSPNAAG